MKCSGNLVTLRSVLDRDRTYLEFGFRSINPSAPTEGNNNIKKLQIKVQHPLLSLQVSPLCDLFHHRWFAPPLECIDFLFQQRFSSPIEFIQAENPINWPLTLFMRSSNVKFSEGTSKTSYVNDFHFPPAAYDFTTPLVAWKFPRLENNH